MGIAFVFEGKMGELIWKHWYYLYNVSLSSQERSDFHGTLPSEHGSTVSKDVMW
jgi:hypothetical protein